MEDIKGVPSGWGALKGPVDSSVPEEVNSEADGEQLKRGRVPLQQNAYARHETDHPPFPETSDLSQEIMER